MDTMKNRKSPICLLLALLVFPAVIRAFEFFEPVTPPRSVQVIAHRGLRTAAPENTLPALEQCVRHGFEWIEVDLRLTKDGQHVLLHDRSLDRTTDGTGLVSEHTLQEIKVLDAGSWFAPRFAGVRVLTLREALDFCRDRINLYLDCKAIDPSQLVRDIQDARMEAQVIVFGDPETLRAIYRESQGHIATMPHYRTNPALAAWTGSDRPIALEMKYAEGVSAELVSGLKQAGIIPQVQCLGESDRVGVWRKLIEMGVSWIQTDYPEEVIATYTWQRVGNARPVWVTAHRGAKAFAPENTLAAFEKAVRLGVDFIEVDVRPTRDGVFVALHGRSLEHAGLDVNVAEVDLAQVRGLSAGKAFGLPYKTEHLPTVDEVFAWGHGKVRFYVDFKAGEPASLLETMRRHGVVDECVVYGGVDQLAALKTLEPAVKVMPGLGDPNQIETLIERCQPYAFDARWTILSEALIRECHRRGVKVFSDALGDHERIEDYRQAIAWGIDCIQTDEPLRVFRAIELSVQR